MNVKIILHDNKLHGMILLLISMRYESSCSFVLFYLSLESRMIIRVTVYYIDVGKYGTNVSFLRVHS